MNAAKESRLAIGEHDKESIAERLRHLIGSRTVRAAAQDWGLAFSTLNNYLTRGTEPSLNVALKISNIEGVPVEWLATGKSTLIAVDEAHRSSDKGFNTEIIEKLHNSDITIGLTATPIKDEKFMSMTWGMFFDTLTADEKSKLIDIFAKMGTKSVLALLSEESEYAGRWLNLTSAEKERLLRLHEQLKKGSSELDSGVTEPDPEANSKKVG